MLLYSILDSFHEDFLTIYCPATSQDLRPCLQSFTWKSYCDIKSCRAAAIQQQHGMENTNKHPYFAGYQTKGNSKLFFSHYFHTLTIYFQRYFWSLKKVKKLK